MPIYEYECQGCGYCEDYLLTFDQMKNTPPTECSKCKSAVKQVFGGYHAHYKGPGFKTTEARGITGRKRKPEVKVGMVSDLSPEEREKRLG